MLKLRKEEARAITLCAVLLCIVAAVSFGISRCTDREADNAVITKEEAARIRELETEIKTDSAKRRQNQYSPHLAAQLFPFDPNHADSVTLRKLGLSEWQVANMMKYRRKGGKWRSPDDFHRLYGLSANDFERIKPYVRIREEDRRSHYVPFERPRYADNYDHYGTPTGEKPQYEKQEKLAEGTTLDLNTADTTELKKIPGIGSYYASKIVNYRERLGGFVSTTQIDEIEGLPPGASRWFTNEKAPTVRKLSINKATFKELVRHPYLSYEQTKAIANYRSKYGKIQSWRDLHLFKEFTDEDFRRLTPYIDFN